MTETQVDIATLVMKLFGSSRQGIQFPRHLVEYLLVWGDEPSGNTVDIVLKHHPRVMLHQTFNRGEEIPTFSKKNVVMHAAKGIPLPVVVPPTPTIRFVDMSFTGKNVVRNHGRL
jgi:hypothetical protein